jgi:hypothetical protein
VQVFLIAHNGFGSAGGDLENVSRQSVLNNVISKQVTTNTSLLCSFINQRLLKLRLLGHSKACYQQHLYDQ